MIHSNSPLETVSSTFPFLKLAKWRLTEVKDTHHKNLKSIAPLSLTISCTSSNSIAFILSSGWLLVTFPPCWMLGSLSFYLYNKQSKRLKPLFSTYVRSNSLNVVFTFSASPMAKDPSFPNPFHAKLRILRVKFSCNS